MLLSTLDASVEWTHAPARADDADIARVTDPTTRAESQARDSVRGTSRFCKSGTHEEIATHDFVITPGRYVGAEEAEVDTEPITRSSQASESSSSRSSIEADRLET